MLSMSSDEEEYSEIATPDLINYDERKMVNDKFGSVSLCKLFFQNSNLVLAIFDLNNDEKREPDIQRANWLATIKVRFIKGFTTVKLDKSYEKIQGLAIALFGAGVCYGIQSVCVKELSLQEKPLMAMETLAFRSIFQVLVFLPATILSGSNIIPAKGKKLQIALKPNATQITDGQFFKLQFGIFLPQWPVSRPSQCLFQRLQ